MADSYHVRIDLAKMATNLSAVEKRTVTHDDVYQFLTENCFVPLPGGKWLCEEISLGMLHESEIIEMESAD